MGFQILPQAQPKQASLGKRFSNAVGAGLETGSQILKEHQQKQAIKSLMGDKGEDISNLPPEMQKLAYQSKLTGENERAKRTLELQGNQDKIDAIEDERGLKRGTLKAFVSDPAMAERISKPEKESKRTQASKPIDPDQLKIIKDIRNTEEYQKASPLKKYQILTDAGVSKENSQAESDIAAKESDLDLKKTESAYKAQEDFINDTTSSYKAFETETKPKLLQMRNIRDEDLIGPTAAVFLETLGIPLGALDDPSSELYNKLSLDLLKGLPETYGNRILKVEVDNFLKTIPSLLNSPDGRRMIASNMLKLGEMKEVYYKEMRRQQKESLDVGKPLARDFQQNVFDQVKPQIDRINSEFVQLSQIKSVPKDTVPMFTPNGQIKFIPKDQEAAAVAKGGRKIW